MRTLYDFLGALPDDDAESVRAAFRRAAKDAHPDLNPADPDAGLRFRQIVRANEILSDEEQRATYDRLLHLARIEQGPAPKRAAIDRIAIGVGYGVIALAGILVVSIAGQKLFLLINGPPLAPAQVTQTVTHEPEQAVAVTTELPDPLARADRHDKPESFDIAHEAFDITKELDANLEYLKQATAPSVAALAQGLAAATAGANGPAIRDFAINDAKHYREQGILAYRNGDLYLALVDFNLAIQFDPGFLDAYIDRAIVFYRMGNQERAFADVTQARRLHESNRSKTPPTTGAP